MSYTIRPSAEVQFKKAPTIAVGGPTGSGKTESAMRLARGYVGPQGKFLVIDTEQQRALYKKARYQPWDWMDLQPPFTPERYGEALEAAKGYDAVVVDSGSHEYAGDGGLQDMHDAALERMAKGDVGKMERLNAVAWKEPKQRHKKLMSKIIRYPTLLIVCLRAEPKVKFIKDAEGKTKIVDAGYQPICEKMFGFEMLVFAMMHADNPGVPVHLKKLEPDLEPVFLDNQQIDESTGARLAEWASTRSAPPTPAVTGNVPPASNGTGQSAESEFLSEAQVAELSAAFTENKTKRASTLLKNVGKLYGYKIERLSQIKAVDFDDAILYARS
jgi:hypothetical protein